MAFKKRACCGPVGRCTCVFGADHTWRSGPGSGATLGAAEKASGNHCSGAGVRDILGDWGTSGFAVILMRKWGWN